MVMMLLSAQTFECLIHFGLAVHFDVSRELSLEFNPQTDNESCCLIFLKKEKNIQMSSQGSYDTYFEIITMTQTDL